MTIGVKSLAGVAAAAVVGAAAPALADHHFFGIEEVYSNADGSVQFIEFHEMLNQPFQDIFAGRVLTSRNADGTQSRTFTFPSNLPNFQTANKRFVLATPGFALLPGGITPDYTIPANFVFREGGTLTLTTLIVPTVAFGSLPVDGESSVDLTTGEIQSNSPTNYAGITGHVDLPGGACCTGEACALVLQTACSGTFSRGAVCGPGVCQPPACRADFDGSGGALTVGDIFAFLSAWFANDPRADFDADESIAVSDIFAFLSAWFAGC